MKSLLKEIGPTPFPENTGERIYMLPFTRREGLPPHLARWQLTIDAMLLGVEVEGPIYLMIDQGMVKAGESHRRGGAHIDGNWWSGVKAHGAGTRHGAGPPPPPPGHNAHRSRVAGSKFWHPDDFAPEALILASDVTASCAYVGEIDGIPLAGGDCSHLDLAPAIRVPLLAGRAYAGNVTMVHESLPVERDTMRTLVRLNVPGFVFEP